MPTKYPFEKITSCAGTTAGQGEYLPIIQVTFTNDKHSFAVPALIDTGAAHTFIDLRLATALRLMPVGIVRILENHKVEIKPMANIILQTECMRGKTMTLPVVKTSIIHPLYKAILGRNFLEEFEFSYNGLHGMLALRYLG